MPSTSHVKITEYVGPTAVGERIAAAVILAAYAAGIASRWAVPGSTLWGLLENHAPGGAENAVRIARYGALLLAAAHGAEVLLFDQLRMRKHGVPRWSGVWWQWQLSVFVEGMGAWARIGKLIAKKQAVLKSK
ncbi:hypothetical protein ISF_00271 [Cordyceps fumosorosea ARSEF 2679]|uniref:Uncharacterized protein n=1 Tax=Cordyceps fumosorosea (strain ARSEF 2679) TaxID=1081104 RepID=A0A168E4K6_CORFA|nr:hypothetical protein ISF_00271 [Cordyceps fumosorosea ARSEF 2679]OAA73370.1 hypothetical protein ISF_00271 [Cordyceps fumosorosea ARSEF 2679]